MEKLNDLRDLLKHEIQDLYSVEEQIIAAMPNMIAKASNAELKRSLEEHLRVTEQQKARLDQVQQAFGDSSEQEEKGLLSRLFKTKMVCKGMQGIITEGNQILSANMNPDVMDAAIIACAQKIEHYEICGYGTAKAFARELNMPEVERLLDQTLNEEYNADDLLTALAVGRLNKEAETAGNSNGSSKPARATSGSTGNTRRSTERVPQEEMEMEMASASKSRSAGRGTAAPAKGTNAPKGSAGGRTASGNAPAASKTSGARSTASKSGMTGTSTGKSITGSSAGKTGSAGRGGSSSRTR